MRIFKTVLTLFYIGIILFIAVSYFISRNNAREVNAILLIDNDYLNSISADLFTAKDEIICAIPMFKTDYRYQKKLDEPITILVNSFINASERGVKVTLILETSQEGKYLQKENIKTAKLFKDTDITIFYDEDKSRLNSKLCVIDSNITYIGSHNFTYSAMKRNKEASSKITSASFAADSKKYLKSIAKNRDNF